MGFRATLCVHCTACGGVTFFGWIRNRLDQKQTRSETNGSSQQPTKKIPQSFGIFQKTTKPKFLTLNPPVVRNPKKTIGLFFNPNCTVRYITAKSILDIPGVYECMSEQM